MPLHQRQVTPINVARKYFGRQNIQELNTTMANGDVKRGTMSDLTPTENSEDGVQRAIDTTPKSYVTNSKEEAANRIVANMIRQLANLSQNAHGIFGKSYKHIP